MKQSKLCRLCTKSKESKKFKNLFEKNQKLLTMIKQITGIDLKNINPLPQYICQICLQDLEKANAFRERCIKAQEFFDSVDFAYTKISAEDLQIKDELLLPIGEFKCNKDLDIPEIEIKDELPIEENHLKDFDFVKTEDTDILCDVEPPDISSVCSNNGSSCNSRSCSNEAHDNTFNLDPPKNVEIDSTELVKKSLSKVKRQCRKRTEDKQSELKTFKDKRKESESKKQKSSKNKVTFICDQCGSAFAYRSNFMAHQRRHTGEKLFTCEVCPERFFSNAELELHVRKHTGEKPFACTYCDRRFIKNSVRINHEKTHTNERPYACNQCSKAFTNAFILKNHMVTHTGVRTFWCNLCDKWFGQKPHLITHYKSMMHKQNEEKKQQNMNTISTENLDSIRNGIPVMHKN